MSSGRPPHPKKRLALLFGYTGTGYSGLQLNPGARTIESVLLEALTQAGVVWSVNAVDPSGKLDWQRACRTDKGVHATGNVLSFKGHLVGGTPDNERWDGSMATQLVNSHLPTDQIRVFDIVRVTNSFDAHRQCDSRFYEYLLPTAVLADASLAEFCASVPVNEHSNSSNDGDGDDNGNVGFQPLTDKEMSLYRHFRITQDKLEALNAALAAYCGTHSFYNFTVGKTPDDPSVQRFIRSFAVVGESFVDSGDDIEWIRLRVHGASFMLHQIRKMVGLVILAIRFNLDGPGLVRMALSSNGRINVPKAPSVGLYLDKAVFDGYNRYLRSTSAPGVPDIPLDLARYEAQRETLKRELVYPAIFGPGVIAFAHWLEGLQSHFYEFGYLMNFKK